MEDIKMILCSPMGLSPIKIPLKRGPYLGFLVKSLNKTYPWDSLYNKPSLKDPFLISFKPILLY